ncbi:alpha/beta hydrolase [Couchioplanes caeruleus]|uniref:alpha/beta hydrolase n=1 Tax=Couchioplanes caeruleus TaxID=56438 RepID=UPI0020BDCCE7|nr:alpha/beta hydrolase [Couchioplanes caeruleus]UQU68177.1 alpha/beta hydrolase [Couchioplanes caeruleus]
MDAVFVLVHSPSVGPSTWTAVADRLPGSLVPSLTGVADAGPPFWPAAAELVGAAIAEAPADAPVVLVPHSNAGLFLPAIVAGAPRPVAAVVFVDASLPARDGPSPVADADGLAFLRERVGGDGRLPPWTHWFDEADVAPMFADAATRELIEDEQPRLPLAYYEQRLPTPAGWDRRPCAYVQFSEPYAADAADAAARGWPVEVVPGAHLHQVVDPDAVAAAIGRLGARLVA